MAELIQCTLNSNDNYMILWRFWAKIGHGACPTGVTCLPIMGNVLAPLGQICCQTNAQLILIAYSYPCFQDSANTENSCRLNSSHLTITFIWRLLTPDNSFHPQTIQTIGWQSSDSQLSVCQNVTMKNQTIWQFRLFLGYMTFFFILFPLWLFLLFSFLSQIL